MKFLLLLFVRILDLLPGIQDPLAIDPALPASFVAKPVDEKEPSFYQGYVWADKDAIDEIIQDPKKAKEPFFLLSISRNVSQVSADKFSFEENFEKDLTTAGFANIQVKRLSWGTYPVLAIEAENREGKKHYVAWIGLNAEPIMDLPSAGVVLVVNFVFQGKEPSKADLALWNRFLEETKPLPEREAQEAYGYEMQEEGTLFSRGKIKIKVTAKRVGERVDVKATPLSPNTEFTIKHVREAPLATEWHHGKPSVKVFGEATYEKGEDSETVFTSIPVLINES